MKDKEIEKEERRIWKYSVIMAVILGISVSLLCTKCTDYGNYNKPKMKQRQEEFESKQRKLKELIDYL